MIAHFNIISLSFPSHPKILFYYGNFPNIFRRSLCRKTKRQWPYLEPKLSPPRDNSNFTSSKQNIER